MEKLIELLKNWDGRNITYNKQSDLGYMFRLGDLALREERICSKKFGFIKWLVENDKIDQWRVTDKEKMSCWELVERDIDDFPKKEKLIERLLMLLSISDTPIEDLISYLK